MNALAPGSTAWFARHEARLAWRDTIAMMTGGKPRRAIGMVIGVAVFALMMHWLAYVLLAPQVSAGIIADKATLALLSGGALFSFAVMLSQAIESVTRAYYARSDLDLLLASPASTKKLFAVRTSAIGIGTVALTCLLASPVINALVLLDGPHWLMAYGVLATLGAVAAGFGILLTLLLFHLVGAKRARLTAQIVAAVIGGGFVIGIQAVAILNFGSFSRLTLFQSADALALLPGPEHFVWLPARAALGDGAALIAVMVLGFGFFALVTAISAPGFGGHALSAASIGRAASRTAGRHVFRQRTPRQVLRNKEWTLLRRDPWLLSQTLMQILYLIPPALLLWSNYGDASGVAVVLVPVLVMASGQLAGGLAWLAISGEDAHDLVATAPVAPRTVLIAKIEAVLGAVVMLVGPLLAAFALFAPLAALIALAGVVVSASSATAIQMWFRTQARRAMFRRRQTSSRIATLAEAFTSIFWAGTGVALALGSWIAVLAIVPAILALVVLLIAWLIRPRAA